MSATNIYIILIIVLLLIFKLIHRNRKKRHAEVHFGLGEGPMTTMELREDPNLRLSYANFKTEMFASLSVKYNEVKVIAAGGMGIIVSAIDKETKKKVAIKTIAPKLYNNPKAIKFFFQEFQAIQRMNHPNIIRIYDSYNEGFLYYVMEYLEGETLEDLMNREGILPIRSVVRIGTQVARALQHCHSNGIVHRDVKPSNIFISSKNNSCKIIDFGVVKDLDSETQDSTAIGSPHYAAPEQLQAGQISGKSDIYALGVCIFKMVSGEYPYDDADLATKVFKNPRKIENFRSDIPAKLVKIIYDSLALDPKERSNAKSLWERLRNIKK